MPEHLIGIDHGYASIKTRSTVFPAGVVPFDAPPPVQQGLLEYGGHYYACGGGRQPLVKDKTSNPNYYLLTLAAIAKELTARGAPSTEEIVLCVGLPLTSFGREMLHFRSYLTPEKQPVRFAYESVPYEITIKDVHVLPQGYSAIAVNMPLIQHEPSVIVADLGGWTLDLMRLDHTRVDAATCRSLELGVIRCMDEIREQVRRSIGLSITDAQVETVLQGKHCTIDEKAVAVIRRQGRLYVERVLSAIEESGFDPRAIPMVILGGGAGIIKAHVSPQDRLCRPIYLDGMHVNARAYEAIVARQVRP